VIYNGIDLDEHDSRSFAPIYTKQDGEIVIGNAGRLTEEKGQAFLIELASELKNRKVNFRILIAGKGQLETRLKRLAQKSEVHDKIEFLGFIQNIRDFYSSLDVYALTSIWEGFGYVLIEAMADMIPVIAFDIGSSREIVKEGETGYIVGFKDVKGLADRIEQFYLDRKLMKSMGSKGRKRVEHVFAMDHSMKQINDLLKPDLPE
jgi:glycosyltransferase involved in cell wall biosynthesis